MRLALTLLLGLLAPQALAQVLLHKATDLPGRYIVSFESAAAVPAELRLRKSKAIAGLRRQQAINLERFKNDLRDVDLHVVRDLWIKQAIAISVSSRHLPRIRAIPYVREVRNEQQYQARPQGVVTLPLSGELAQDSLERIEVDPLWSELYRGQGVVVAILDSGVDLLHADLVDRWRGGSNSWFDPYAQQLRPKDLTGHGTAVASLVLGGDAGGSFIGVAPHAQWIAGRIFDNSGNSSESAISATLQWILDPDNNASTDDFPDIVQNSWGLEGTEGACANPFATELAAIDALGIDQVFAVGNSALTGPGPGGFSSFLTPSFDSHVISVGALRTTDTLLFSSSRGPDICGSSIIPSLVAPGELVRSADLTFDGFDPDNMTVNSGTSFASPYVSGAIALLRSKFIATDHREYRDAIFSSAIDLGGQNDYGRGKLQVSAAATLIQNQSTPLRTNEVGFGEAIYAFKEDDVVARVPVIRSGDISTAASVDIQSVDGSAISTDDFQAIAATLDFAAGESVKMVDITPTDDSVEENAESFSLVLDQNVNINLGAKSTIVVTLTDDDGPVDEADEVGGSAGGLAELFFFVLLLISSRVRR